MEKSMIFKRLLLLLALLNTLPLFGSDLRTRNVDLYIIFDDSTMTGPGRTEALRWLCETVIDRLLQAGDRLVICSAGEGPEILFNKSITGDDQKAEAKNLLQNTRSGGPNVNYAAALRAAARREPGRYIAYTLLVGGISMRAASAAQEADIAELLKYSKTEDFSGWKVITVGLGIDTRAGSAAASYMNR
jgi:hypothetical protein